MNGAPGAGKGTHTRFILNARGITAPPIVMSDLLRSEPEFGTFIERGDMIPDYFVVRRLFRELLKEQYRHGVQIDGFPRTTMQVECMKLLKEQMMQLCRDYPQYGFTRPLFKIVILYISEAESVQRQLVRGQQARAHNQRVRETSYGELVEERSTDFDEALILKRYHTFAEHRKTLFELKQYFPYFVIDASGTIEEVQQNILREFAYQSSHELGSATFEKIQRVPLATEIASNARQELVARLERYQCDDPDQFDAALRIITDVFVPKMHQCAFAGAVLIRTEVRPWQRRSDGRAARRSRDRRSGPRRIRPSSTRSSPTSLWTF